MKAALKRPWFARALSFATVALLFALLWRFTDMHYALGDDSYIARAFAGEVGGVKDSYNAFVHTLFAWPLHWMSVAFPGVHWFSWLQLALLFAGNYGVMLGCVRLFTRLRLPLLGGWLAGAAFVAGLTLEFSTSITFTTTAAVLGAGAVCLLGGAELTGQNARRELLGSAALLLLAYLLREMTAVPVAAFWVGLLLCRALCDKRIATPRVCRGFLLCAALFAAFLGVRLCENALTPEKDYLSFMDSTVVPIDYGGLSDAKPETLRELGWTEKEVALVRSWYFMDGDMGASSFWRITKDAEEAPKPPLAQRLSDVSPRVRSLFQKNRNIQDFCLLCLGLCGAAFLAACFGKSRNPWRYLAPVGCATVALLLLAYLALEGRLPMRVAALVFLPACAMALCLAAEGAAGLRGARALPALLALACCVLVCGHAAKTAYGFAYNPAHGDPNQCVLAEAERYALANESKLFIGDRTLGADRRLFPDRTAGSPTNLLPMWGGWNYHSAGYRAALSQAGLRHDAFWITDFLGDDVRLVTGEAGVSPEFLAYLNERAGGPVTPVAEYQSAGFTVYRFVKGMGQGRKTFVTDL